MIAMASKAEAARKSQAASLNAQRLQAAKKMEPEVKSLLLADEKPLRYAESMAPVPSPVEIAALPLVDTESLVQEAELCIQKYLDAATWQDRALYVYDADRLQPLMEDFYVTQNAVDPVIGALIDKGRYRINDTELLIFSYRSQRVHGKLEIALLKNASGKWLIDWESFVGYSERSFSALKKEKPIRPVLMRGMVKIDDYYNHEFSDAKVYLSIIVESADGDEAINAFCRRDSEMARWLINDLGNDASTSLTKGYCLRVSFPKDAQSNRCLNLVQIAAGRWLSVALRP